MSEARFNTVIRFPRQLIEQVKPIPEELERAMLDAMRRNITRAIYEAVKQAHRETDDGECRPGGGIDKHL